MEWHLDIHIVKTWNFTLDSISHPSDSTYENWSFDAKPSWFQSTRKFEISFIWSLAIAWYRKAKSIQHNYHRLLWTIRYRLSNSNYLKIAITNRRYRFIKNYAYFKIYTLNVYFMYTLKFISYKQVRKHMTRSDKRRASSNIAVAYEKRGTFAPSRPRAKDFNWMRTRVLTRAARFRGIRLQYLPPRVEIGIVAARERFCLRGFYSHRILVIRNAGDAFSDPRIILAKTQQSAKPRFVSIDNHCGL